MCTHTHTDIGFYPSRLPLNSLRTVLVYNIDHITIITFIIIFDFVTISNAKDKLGAASSKSTINHMKFPFRLSKTSGQFFYLLISPFR